MFINTFLINFIFVSFTHFTPIHIELDCFSYYTDNCVHNLTVSVILRHIHIVVLSSILSILHKKKAYFDCYLLRNAGCS